MVTRKILQAAFLSLFIGSTLSFAETVNQTSVEVYFMEREWVLKNTSSNYHQTAEYQFKNVDALSDRIHIDLNQVFVSYPGAPKSLAQFRKFPSKVRDLIRPRFLFAQESIRDTIKLLSECLDQAERVKTYLQCEDPVSLALWAELVSIYKFNDWYIFQNTNAYDEDGDQLTVEDETLKFIGIRRKNFRFKNDREVVKVNWNGLSGLLRDLGIDGIVCENDWNERCVINKGSKK